jgi:hypothetical protein
VAQLKVNYFFFITGFSITCPATKGHLKYQELYVESNVNSKGVTRKGKRKRTLKKHKRKAEEKKRKMATIF